MENIKAADQFLNALGSELKGLLGDHGVESIISGKDETRRLLESILSTIDAVNAYKSIRRVDEVPQIVETTEPVAPQVKEPLVDSEWKECTFNRKIHGGSVDFGSDLSRFIPETVVNRFDLQHGARILAKMDNTGYVTIKEVIEHGNDNDSSIRHVAGVLLKDSGEWCVAPLHDKESIYNVHPKDVDSRNDLVEGAPCVYNIDLKRPNDDVRIARILEHSSAAQETAVTSAPPATKEKASAEEKTDKPKPFPFLKGCTVVVLGGQKKWFETAVAPTGANFVHENGKTPDRVIPELKKAQALCILETATSHHAYFDCKETAKKYGVPMFKIQGSKKSLARVLEENSKTINAANRK
ncbi:hypothetical protein IAQ67_28675 (plasmid) [Paenibacillus peoriae]|uniref:DUF2325 domain-containing protein n=1 Tax=Paenibacillus peoriae TaxID=59893 RepID=A0A7H0YHC9_9BACL|nr:hypothetical protein [Paenibacillus peoriae]QNR70487.1 hypothetical protein IAQ67_28675 [Paenibacillus peoriae]